MIFNSLFNRETRSTNITLPDRYIPPQSLTGGLAVTEGTTLSIPAAYRCVQLISEGIALENAR